MILKGKIFFKNNTTSVYDILLFFAIYNVGKGTKNIIIFT